MYGVAGIFKIHIKKLIMLILFIIIIIEPTIGFGDELYLTNEEINYINQGNIIKAVSMNGGAPIQYADENGEIKGISRNVLEEISAMTGLIFEYQLYDTLKETLNSDADIVFGLPHNYAPDNMTLSVPYLESQTILYINSSLDPSNLDDRIYAAVKGSALPEGVNEETAIYFDTREESLDAVESGEADYGIGNQYSVAFYSLQNNYKNIVTIPKEVESREYCIGFINNNDILISIINKSINSIDESIMNTLILNTTTQIDRDITFQMILDAYGIELFVIISLIIVILLLSIIINIRAKNQLKMQNKRYVILSQTSNEYLYEYYIATKHLDLSNNCIQLFGNGESLSQATTLLKKALVDNNFAENIPIIKLPIANGKEGIFRSVNSPLYDDKGHAYSIIGKLVDIEKDVAEKEKLITQSQIDGLTGLYNAITTKKLITERIANADSNSKDAMIVIDCDKFKFINDNFGHLQGNNVLINISRSLTQIFRKTDIMGRIGGDEFCVYIHDVPSVDFVVSKCKQLMILLGKSIQDYDVSVSIGISLLSGEESYEELFEKADNALYVGKKQGGGQIIIREQ